MDQLTWLKEDDYAFPAPSSAFTDPNGLLAAGGDLSPQRILTAYRLGIFPWYEEDQPILWWSPDPRMVLFPDELVISKSLKKNLRNTVLKVTYNQAFSAVISACASRKDDSEGTWITDEMKQSYCHLHEQGYAHSVEVWDKADLVGGLYGLMIGKVFCGESMFSYQNNASKIAFVHLVRSLQQQGCELIDCQVPSNHLASLGAREISRKDFITYLPGDDNSIGNSIQWPID